MDQPIQPNDEIKGTEAEGDREPISIFRSPGFWGGFLGWFAINWVTWSLLFGDMGFGLISFPINLIVLIVTLAVKDARKVGLGIMAALGVNFLISLVLGVVINGVCMIPFYIHW